MRPLTVCTFILLMVATAAAVTPSRYQPGELLNAVVTVRDQVGTSAGNCYELIVRVDQTAYVLQECPNFYWNSFEASEFMEGGELHVRVDGHKLCILRPNGKELKPHILRRVKWDLYKTEWEREHEREAAARSAVLTYH